jgi:hypothetical protein
LRVVAVVAVDMLVVVAVLVVLRPELDCQLRLVQITQLLLVMVVLAQPHLELVVETAGILHFQP